jgi:C-terminal processing protease CtpA/Prc
MIPDGGRFEGVGTRPDVEVSPTVEDLRAGRDVELEAARARLLSPAERAGERRQSHIRSESAPGSRGQDSIAAHRVRVPSLGADGTGRIELASPASSKARARALQEAPG